MYLTIYLSVTAVFSLEFESNVQEFLDLRTLSFNNILMSFSFASCLLIYSAYHPEFKGIKQTAYAFFISGVAFLLMGFRSYIPDFFSILVPNTLLVLSMSLIHLGLVHFYKFDARIAKRIHILLVVLMTVFAVHFTYFDNNVNARVVVISSFVGIQCFYVMKTLLKAHNKANRTIAVAYLIFGTFYITRAVLTLSDTPLNDFMKGGLLHSLSIVVYELLVAVTSFGVVWIVSYNVQRGLTEQATHDPLTNLLNRRALEEIITAEHSRSVRSSAPMSVIMLDIDHFKQINDRFGHGRGDSILIEIANVLITNTRPYDSIARFGGEEFIILLPNTTVHQAETIAENLRIKIANHDYNFKPEERIEITASFGATECNLVKEGWLRVLERADKGLYKAKAAGRNNVIVCHPNNEDADIIGAG